MFLAGERGQALEGRASAVAGIGSTVCAPIRFNIKAMIHFSRIHYHSTRRKVGHFAIRIAYHGTVRRRANEQASKPSS